MDTSHSDQLHRLADTTYRVKKEMCTPSNLYLTLTSIQFQNTEELIVDLKSLVAAAKVYQRAMEGKRTIIVAHIRSYIASH